MLYSIGFFIFSVFYLPTLIFKGKFHASLKERLAVFDKMKERALLSGSSRIWIQAVSVGEVALCKSLVSSLKERFPDRDIVISTVTKTGNDLAKKIFGRDAIIIYFPLDLRFIVRKAIGLIRPSLYIMIETEIWPNLLTELSCRKIPAILINGRISDRSIGKYRLAKVFLKRVLGYIDIFCMQDSVDAERIMELGAPAERVKVTGNMKFDAAAVPDIKDQNAIRASFGVSRGEDLLVAGSTHEGEEDILMDVYNELLSTYKNLRLLIAPRHVERAGEIENTAEKKGFKPLKFSQAISEAQDPGRKSVIILDKIGHLNDAYSVATLVFVGGSLVKHGGQNPIEPAYFAKCIFFGQHMFNFKYIAGALLKNTAAIQVVGREDLYNKMSRMLKDRKAMEATGMAAKGVIFENLGATKRNISEISKLLK